MYEMYEKQNEEMELIRQLQMNAIIAGTTAASDANNLNKKTDELASTWLTEQKELMEIFEGIKLNIDKRTERNIIRQFIKAFELALEPTVALQKANKKRKAPTETTPEVTPSYRSITRTLALSTDSITSSTTVESYGDKNSPTDTNDEKTSASKRTKTAENTNKLLEVEHYLLGSDDELPFTSPFEAPEAPTKPFVLTPIDNSPVPGQFPTPLFNWRPQLVSTEHGIITINFSNPFLKEMLNSTNQNIESQYRDSTKDTTTLDFGLFPQENDLNNPEEDKENFTP